MRNLSSILGDKTLFQILKIFSNHNLLLFLLFIFVLGSRLFFAYNAETFTYDSYGDLRHIYSIRDSGLHIITDELSYGGRSFVILPLSHYIIGLSSILIPESFALKFVPNLFASIIVVIIYLIILRITQNKNASLFGAFVGGFTPIFFSETFASLSSISIAVPLIFLFFYSFMRLNNNKYVYLFILLSIILPLTSLLSLVLILTLLIYLLLSKVEDFKFTKKGAELTIFFSFFSIWFFLMVFKKVFIEEGPNIVASAIPESVQGTYFQDFSFLQLFGGLGLLSIIISSYVIYNHLFNYKNKEVYLFFSFIISLLIFMWLDFVRTSHGLILIAVTLSIFVGIYFNNFFNYLNRTTLSHLKNKFVILFIILFIINSVLFSFLLIDNPNIAKKSEVRSMEWVNLNTPKDATVIAPLIYGHLVSSIGERKNVMDTNFLLAPSKNSRIKSLDKIYSTNSYLYVINEASKYNGEYLLIPGGVSLDYLKDQCFRIVYNKEVKIYKIECGVVK